MGDVPVDTMDFCRKRSCIHVKLYKWYFGVDIDSNTVVGTGFSYRYGHPGWHSGVFNQVNEPPEEHKYHNNERSAAHSQQVLINDAMTLKPGQSKNITDFPDMVFLRHWLDPTISCLPWLSWVLLLLAIAAGTGCCFGVSRI